jgi:acyl-CoA synthetase (AMP-forming)/AMP-acid ligase II
MGKNLTIIGRLIELAQSNPDRPAVIYKHKIITYKQLLEKVEALAHSFYSKNIRQGVVVASIHSHSLEHIVSMLAIARVGGIVIPINPKFSPKVINNILVKYKATFILSNLKNKKVYNFKLSVIDTASLVHRGKIKNNVKINFPKLTDSFIIAIPLLLSMNKIEQLNPKAIMYSHAYLNKRMERTLDQFTDNIRLIPPDLNFTMGYITTLGSLFLGGLTIILNSNQPQSIYLAINLYAATHIFISSKSAETIMNFAAESTKKMFPSLIHLRILEGQPNRNLIKKLINNFSSNLYASYGSAETGGLTLATPEILKKSYLSSGKPRGWVKLEVLNHKGKKARSNEVGLIRAKGELVPTEYWNDPELTKTKFRQGWFYTGDYGYIDKAGELFLSH